MEKSRSPFNLIAILLVVLLIAIIGAVVFIVFTINQPFQTPLTPILNVNQRFSTQDSKLLNPTPTVIPDPVTIIREVQSLARLETIQYSVEKVITAELNQGVLGPLFGDRLLFVAHGYVIGGVDLAALDRQDLLLEDGVLYVTLPEAEVFVATLDNDKSYVYDRDTGLFKKSDKELETTARKAAEKAILDAALEDGILQQAQQNAEVYLERLFNSLGYLKVVFKNVK